MMPVAGNHLSFFVMMPMVRNVVALNQSMFLEIQRTDFVVVCDLVLLGRWRPFFTPLQTLLTYSGFVNVNLCWLDFHQQFLK